jgi:hypothetical protein
MATHAPDYVK